MRKLPNQLAAESRQFFAPPVQDQRSLDDIAIETHPETDGPRKTGKLKQTALFDDTVSDDWGDSEALRKSNNCQRRLL